MSHRTDYQLKMILKYNKDGSQNTCETRHQNLTRFIKHMQEKRGYSNHWDLHKLGKKEIHRYVHDLKNRGLAHRTIENNLKDIRWLSTKVNRENFMPSNRDCGLKKRSFSNVNKAIRLNTSHLSRMDKRMRLINRLKAEFGLREKEALKFGHKFATAQAGKIFLKDTWCKNGRPRTVEIVNNRQELLLIEIGEFQEAHGDYSMIPHELKFNTYRNYIQANSKEIDIKGHSFRHQWAQDRFKQLSGLDCPIAGGSCYTGLSGIEKIQWDNASYRVNKELGHGEGRMDITATYIGVG
ncbi:MAG: phage integrase N-terminal domain-containing protein [Cocleimonas sp.]